MVKAEPYDWPCTGALDLEHAALVLIDGEPGWEIIDELAPIAAEMVIDKATKGAFSNTDQRCRRPRPERA